MKAAWCKPREIIIVMGGLALSLDILLCATTQNEAFARRLLSDLIQKSLPGTRIHLEVQSRDSAFLQKATSDEELEKIFPVPRDRLVLVVFATDLEPRSDDYLQVQVILKRSRVDCIVIVRFDPHVKHQTRVFSLKNDPDYGTLIDLNAPNSHTSDVLRLLMRLHDGDDPKLLGPNFKRDSFFPLPHAGRGRTVPNATIAPTPNVVLESSTRKERLTKLSRGPRVIGPRILPVFIILAMVSAIAFALLN